MATSDNKPTARAGEISIDASQLRPGVHVRLPIPWMQHEFVFNSFVIASEDQARQIAALNLPSLFCEVARCKVPPLPKRENAPPPDPASAEERARLAALTARQMQEKIVRTKVMVDLRGRLDVAQKHYMGASRTMLGALDRFDLNPKESIRQVAKVSEISTAALLADPDSAIVLIAEKGHDEGHAAHALSVMTLALLLGKQAKLPQEALCAIGIGALLHDIGNASISPTILRNAARNRHEEAVYQSHCRLGYEAALRAGTLTAPMLDAILHHHERMDGEGFPDRLAGDQIQLAARIVAIANRFDNLANPVDYRRAMSPSEALSVMWAKEKQAYDYQLLQLFVRAMGVYPPGSIVLLTDGRVAAVVTSATADSPLAPQVMLYEPDVPRREAIIVDLARETSVKIERPLRLHDRPAEELDYLLPRRKISWFHSNG